jgi:hypothetical protein
VLDRYVRQYFYDMASDAALEAVILCSNRQFTNRMKMTVMFPEMNPSVSFYFPCTLSLYLCLIVAPRINSEMFNVDGLIQVRLVS